MRKGAVILFRDGYCYQSYAWKIERPLGKIQNVLDHLEEYNVSFYSDILELSKIKSSTPLSFGGGLNSIDRIDSIRSLCFERFIFSNSLLLSNSNVINYAYELCGKQAVIGCLPVKYINNILMIYNSKLDKFISLESINYKSISKCDELLVVDCSNEGSSSSFNFRILDQKIFNSKKIIISGGVNFNKKLKSKNNIISILIENRVLHTEYSLKR